MSDNNEPLDLAPIEQRLAAATPGPWKEYKWEIHPVLDYGASGNDCHAICTEFYGPQAMQNRVLVANAPTDIAALLQRVKELEAELAEAKRTQVKDGGRGQLRPFPEPDEEE